MNYWETITEADVLGRFNGAEATIFRGLAGGQDQLKAVLCDTVKDIQGAIKAGGGNVPAEGQTPKSLRSAVISITIWDWITCYSSNEKLQTKAREKKYDRAMALIERVRTGDCKVENLDAGQSDTVLSPVTMPSVGTRPHRFTHRDENGI